MTKQYEGIPSMKQQRSNTSRMLVLKLSNS